MTVVKLLLDRRMRGSSPAYWKDLTRWPPLSSQMEQRYGLLAKQGDAAARDTLVCANLRLVIKVANQYRYSGLEISDLVAEGSIGLFGCRGAVRP